MRRALYLHCHPAHAFSAGTSAFVDAIKVAGSRAKSMRGMTTAHARDDSAYCENMHNDNPIKQRYHSICSHFEV